MVLLHLTRQPANVYPVFCGILFGIVNGPPYVHELDANCSSSLYNVMFIVFALQFACKFDEPLYFSNVELSHVALFAFDVIPDEKDGEEKINIDKKLSNKLHVRVDLCGFM